MRRTMGYIGHKQLKKFTKAIAKVWLNQKLYDPKDRLIFKRENFNNNVLGHNISMLDFMSIESAHSE